jgi:hypothetical protein
VLLTQLHSHQYEIPVFANTGIFLSSGQDLNPERGTFDW